MNEEALQSAVNALSRTVKGACAWVGGSGYAAVADLVSDALGCVSMLLGIVATVYFSRRKKRIMDKFERELDAKEEERSHK